MLWLNVFHDGGALLETTPQGDGSTPVKLPEGAEQVIRSLLTNDEVAAALARLFLAGATAGERAVR